MHDTLSTLVVGADGTISCLWTEAIDLSSLGTMAMRRASTVKFDPARQVWSVDVPDIGEIFAAASREACLSYEREWFAARIG